MRVQQRDRFRTSGLGGVAVLDRGRSDHDGRHQPDRVYGDEAHLARARRPGRGAGGRGRGYGGTAGGRSPEGGVRGSRHVVGLASEGRGESCRPQRRDSRGARPSTASHPGRSFPSVAPARPRCSRPRTARLARRRCTLETRAQGCHKRKRTRRTRTNRASDSLTVNRSTPS
jgi:hypothetical protein